MKPHPKSELLPGVHNNRLTFRAYVGDQFRDFETPVCVVLAAAEKEKRLPFRVLDYSSSQVLFRVNKPLAISGKQRQELPQWETNTGNYICPVEVFFTRFYPEELAAEVLLDYELEFIKELAERLEVLEEDRM